MNRLIIVGNGFDRAHELNSDYYSFIQDYLYNAIVTFIKNKHYDDLLISIRYKTISFPRELYIPDIDKENVFNTIQEFRQKNSKYDIEFKCKSDFFEEICIDAEKKWVDIERTYYKHLIKLFDKTKNEEKTIDSTLEPVRFLNQQMNHLKELLEIYLDKQEQEIYKSTSLRRDSLFREFMEDDFLHNTWKDLQKQQSEKIKNESDKNAIKIDEKIYPEKVLILNFNYTNPFKGNVGDYDVVNIHGLLNSKKNPLVFGYGDERDEKYLELEKSGIDELLKNIKSFAYFQNQNYDELLGFVELNDFEVWIAGHSCGLSDKTLLAHIFEHEHCKSIRIFYYEKDENDNYNEIVYNIARVMSDKIKMRGIVTPKNPNNKFESVGGIIRKPLN